MVIGKNALARPASCFKPGDHEVDSERGWISNFFLLLDEKMSDRNFRGEFKVIVGIRREFLLMGFFVLLTGCAKLVHMQELLTLKAMSDDGDRQKKFIEIQDQKFTQLVLKVKADQMQAYLTKDSILRNFGEPVLASPIEKDGQSLEQWMYRYTMKYFDSDKVYLFFDKKGKLLTWKYVPCPPKDEHHVNHQNQTPDS